MIAEQKLLIEFLDQSNRKYIRKYERLKLGVEAPASDEENNTWDEVGTHTVGGTNTLQSTAMLSPSVKRNFTNITGSDDAGTRSLLGTGALGLANNEHTEQDALILHLGTYVGLLNSLLRDLDEIEYEVSVESLSKIHTSIYRAHQYEMKFLNLPHDKMAQAAAETPLAAGVQVIKQHLEAKMQRLADKSTLTVLDTAGACFRPAKSVAKRAPDRNADRHRDESDRGGRRHRHHRSGESQDDAYFEVFEGYAFTKHNVTHDSPKKTWAFVLQTQMPVSQDDLRREVDKQVRKGGSALEQYQAPEMKGFKREEVDELIRRRNLEDPRVEYKLASIKLEGRRMHGTFQTSSMHVVLRRQLRLDGKVDTSDPVRRVPVVPSEVVDLRNQGKSMEARFQRLPPHGPSNLADHGPNGYPNQPRGKRDSSDSDDGIDGLVEGLAEIAIVDDDRHGGRYEQGKRKPKRKTRTNTLNRWTYTMRRLIKKRSIECCMGDSSASDGGSERTGLEKENYDVHGHVEMEARQQMDRDAEMESGHTDVADDLLALWTTVPAG